MREVPTVWEAVFLIEGDIPKNWIIWVCPEKDKYAYMRQCCHFHQIHYLGVMYSLIFMHCTPSRKQIVQLVEGILQEELNREEKRK